MVAARTPLWTCPKCGERFVSPRLWHSCGRFSADALFSRSEPHVRRIFDRLVAEARDLKSDRAFKREAFGSRHYDAIYVRLERETDVDAGIRRLMKAAYRLGCQEHLAD